VAVSLALDGSASNDSGHLLAEARLGLLLQRVAGGVGGGAIAMSAREMLEIATLGGAQVLNRDDIGALAPWRQAWRPTWWRWRWMPGLAGALHDPLAAIMLCQVPQVDLNVVAGRVPVRDGRLTGLKLGSLVERQNRLAEKLIQGA